MPLQFWCFGTLPLQFVYLDICHCNSVFISIIPFSTLGLTMGLRKDKNALIFTVCGLCGRRTGPATATQRLRQPRGATTRVPTRAAVARAALAGLAMAGGGARLSRGLRGRRHAWPARAAAARVQRRECCGGVVVVGRQRPGVVTRAASNAGTTGRAAQGKRGSVRATRCGRVSESGARCRRRRGFVVSAAVRGLVAGGGDGGAGAAGAAHMACGGAGAVTGSCRGGAHGLGGLRRHGGCGGKLGRRRHGGCGGRLRGRR
ncbi:hypothetical protein GUJ93_ZPchr0006g42788 [Zizania palustris]|uniref:Uncharacterized protein n=1 Tax=Zizania palustris TaxID=103762 RepID=A0A8J5TDC0_ZIZPA|nr:hypothetical protein GUJ93_ZPchr0006g42788 [Zizania palustris]